MLCAAPTVLIGDRQRAGGGSRRAPGGVRVMTAGAPPAAATIERVEGEFGWEITQVYGLTETSPLITVCEPRPEHAALVSRERARIKARQGVELMTSGELRVVDDSGRDVPHDGVTVGEIIVRGNVVMEGYYNDPEATAAAIRDGWFHSGDAAVVHPDGYVEIRDRLKDVIISGGENISSVEVEGVLLRHPAVQEAAVVGLPHEQWGEAPHAFVVLKSGRDGDDDELRSSRATHWPTSRCRRLQRSCPSCPRRRRARFRNSFCAAGGRPSPPDERHDAAALPPAPVHGSARPGSALPAQHGSASATSAIFPGLAMRVRAPLSSADLLLGGGAGYIYRYCYDAVAWGRSHARYVRTATCCESAASDGAGRVVGGRLPPAQPTSGAAPTAAAASQQPRPPPSRRPPRHQTRSTPRSQPPPGALSGQRGGQVAYAVVGTDVRVLNPILQSDTVSGAITDRLFEPLVNTDPKNGSIIGVLAEKWDVSPDSLTYTFHLRDGVPLPRCPTADCRRRQVHPGRAQDRQSQDHAHVQRREDQARPKSSTRAPL